MITKLEKRDVLIKLIENMDAIDIKQLLAYAAGYEAGKTTQAYIKEEKAKEVI